MKNRLIILLLAVGLGINLFGDGPGHELSYKGRWGSGPCIGVVSGEHYAYYLGWRTGLEVLDMSEPERPVQVAGLHVMGHPGGEMPSEKELVLQDGYVYIAASYNQTGESILQVTAVDNPVKPAIAGFLFFKGKAGGLAVSGNYAYVSLREGGVKIIDVSIPSQPRLVASHFIDGATYDLAVKNNYVYAVNKNSMRIIDVSNAASPQTVGTYTLTDNDISSVAVSESGEAAFIGGYGGLVTVDITVPTAPREMNFYPLPYTRSMTVNNNIAYVCAFTIVFLLDIETPASPRELGRWHAFQEVIRTVPAPSGSYLYAANFIDGMRVVDISNPIQPEEIGVYNQFSDGLLGVKVRNSTAYSMHEQALYVIDAGNPAHPYMAGKCDYSGSYPNSLRLQGDYAYHASISGFSVLDISELRHPANLGRWGGRRYQACGLALRDELAFTTVVGDQFVVIDVGDPLDPRQIHSLDGVAVGGIEVYDDYAYVISPVVGLQVIDISPLQSMTQVGTVWVDVPAEIPGWPSIHAIEPLIQGNYLYIPGHRGLEILDISNPSTPVPAALGATGQTAFVSAIAGDYAYVVLEDGSLQIFDIVQPTAPRPAGSLSIPYGAHHVQVSNNYLYITAGNNQLHVYRIGECQPAQVLTPTGTDIWPVGSIREITWTVPGTGDPYELVDLELYRDNYRLGTIAQNLPAAPGTYSWSVGAAVNGSILITAGDGFKIGVRTVGDNCMTLSPETFTIPHPGVSISFAVTKENDSSLFFSRWCNRIEIDVTRAPGAVEISHYILKRSTEYGAFRRLDLIPGAQVQNSYSYFDCTIDEYRLYEYYLEAHHPNGAVIAAGVQPAPHATAAYQEGQVSWMEK